jgi:hypothetical protein
MRIRATCHACNRDFLFFELRHGDPSTTDRCPNCQRPLGVRGVQAVRAEQALAILVHSLEELARRDPNFTVRKSTVLAPIEEALAPLAASEHPAARRRWSRTRAAA